MCLVCDWECESACVWAMANKNVKKLKEAEEKE